MGQFATLCRLLGRPELARPPHLPAGLSSGAFLANVATDALREELRRAFAAAEADGLEQALNEAGVPAAKVRDLGEYLRERYPQTPGIGIDGEPLALAPAFRWADLGRPALPPAPKLGADAETLDISAGFAAPRPSGTR